MSSTLIGAFNVDCTAVALPDATGWAAHLSISGPSSNPMHRHILFPQQRVATERIFATREEAEQAALQIAEDMIRHSHAEPPH
ncbi:hypothetical protein [uncultured Oxalicibacterium sp.]|uniref:hypothetical protein n=1 Tax=uncultured Oxalicibacterium sp. TaxID=1168540 RepID=UPI0025EBBAC3|nr:hypothetical protein [uncultured Oxalicibacterium sp.]